MTGDASLWRWAVGVYARPDVEPLLLDLQDGGGHSVPYLLWVAWMAKAGRSGSPAVLEEGARIARDWEGGVVGPLRQVRRRLRTAPHEGLRLKVKGVELEAERALLERLEAEAGGAGNPVDIRDALDAGARAWDPSAKPGALDSLAGLLR